MIQIKKQKTKQTNKQINIFRSTTFQLNQVQSLQNCQEIFLGVSWDDSNEKTNKLTNKQTNKQISNFEINNISAKSSPIFPKLSANHPWGISRWFNWENK